MTYDNQIYSAFSFHNMDYTHKAYMDTLMMFARDYAQKIDELCPDGREKSLALTKLEEASMWANKSICVGGTNEDHSN